MAGSLLLIVVGRPEHRRSFNHCFSQSEHRLVYTFDGEDAFDRFVEVRPDLVIAYEHAPRLDGILLCQLLRQQGGAQLPFILLTDEAITEERRAATGVDAAISWPFEARELITLVDRFLGQPTRRISLPPARAIAPSTSDTGFDTTDLDTDETSSLDLHGSTLSAVFLDDDAEPTGSLEGDSDDIPTNPGETPFVAGDLLEEPIAPMGIRAHVPDEVTSVQVTTEFFGLFDEPESTDRGGEDDPAELPLVSPVLDDSQDLETRRSDPPALSTDDLGGQTTDTARKRALLEEPPLPSPDQLGAFSRDEDEVLLSRPTTDSRIREIPKETTPTGERPSASASRPDGRVGRGLDESQLGKRLTRRAQQLHKILGELDHYQVLGLEREATKEAIDDAHFDLSIEFHPDRFFLLRSGELKMQIFDIYHRLATAYDVLSDPARRADYDRARSTSVPVPPPAPLTAPPGPVAASPASVETTTGGPGIPYTMTPLEEILSRQVYSARASAQTFIELARSSLDDDDRNGARLYLTIALTQDPDNEGLAGLLESLMGLGTSVRPVPPVP